MAAAGIPPLMAKREHPPNWGPTVKVSEGDGRPEIVPDEEVMTIGGHIKATIGLLAGWLGFLIVINTIGVCLHYIDEKIRADTTVLGSSFWWWALFLDVVIIGWYLLKMFVSIFFIIFKKIKILSFAYYLIAPFKNNVNGILWIVMVTAVHDFILDGSVPRLQTLNKDAADRIVKVLAALLVIFVIFIVKRAIVLVLEIALYRKMEDDILLAELQNFLISPLFSKKTSKMDKHLAMGGNIDDKLIPPGILGWIKLVTMADEMRHEGMHVIDNRLPYGDDTKVPEEILRSEGRHVGGDIFDVMSKNTDSVNKQACIDYCGCGESKGNDIFEMIASKRSGKNIPESIARDDFVEAVEQIFVERSRFQRTLNGRQLLVMVTNDLLTVLAVFISALVILDAFDIDTSSIQGSNLVVLACLTFIFAPFLRDFVASMYMVFFIRPFDLGDYISIDAGQFPGEELLVKKTTVMMTHFRNAAGEMVYISNAIIANSKLHNLSRLEKMD